MFKDLKIYLWLLKLGALVNLYFLGKTFISPLLFVDSQIRILAQIFFSVSAFRCLFPVRYKDNIVFHNSPLSSIFLTRLLASFSEVALIYIQANVIRLFNITSIDWIDILSWAMVVQVVISQFFVWGAILSGRYKYYNFEELGWAFIYTVNTFLSAFLLTTIEVLAVRELLIILNLVFGAVYLPWQFSRLRTLRLDALHQDSQLKSGLRRAVYLKNQTSDFRAWGGITGMIWMTAYWATLMPMWVFLIVLGT